MWCKPGTRFCWKCNKVLPLKKFTLKSKQVQRSCDDCMR